MRKTLSRFTLFPRGGRRLTGGLAALAVVALLAAALTPAAFANGFGRKTFRRIATFPVFENTSIDTETVAEIVASAEGGNLLLYTDSENENIGFVDISDPYNPQPDGTVAVGGEPTSVAVVGRFALAAVNTSADFVNVSGQLEIIDIASRSVVRVIQLGGQPDSVAVSPNGRFAAVAIENERDEDLGDGRPPQLPGGFVVIVDIKGRNNPANWTTRNVSLTGLEGMKFPNDPEPEFIDINKANVAVVTLQENNHIVLIHLPSGRIVHHFPAGEVDLGEIDTVENSLIELNSQLFNVPREPDAVQWTALGEFATADEGDLDGGGRGFTLFGARGRVRFTSGASVEHIVARLGHYPEERSENKGNEPEGMEYARFGFNEFLFVGSERSSVVLVYRLDGAPGVGFPFGRREPKLVQVLPAGLEPEGLLAIPERNLFVVSSEEDDRDDKVRSSITIYELQAGRPAYPTVLSANRPGTDLPIPWGALSALAAGSSPEGESVYTVYDSFYNESRIFKLDVSRTPAVITEEIPLKDDADPLGLPNFNFDPEGIATRGYGDGFWVVSEGSGTVGDPDRPFETPNLLIEVEPDGEIVQVVELPAETAAKQVRFGFEGVTSVGKPGVDELVYVAFQREWAGDPDNHVRIGVYDPLAETWNFLYYPIDEPLSPNGGWVGLSEIVDLDAETFAVIERDNQGGPDARIKKVCTFGAGGLTPQPEAAAPAFDVVVKACVRDLIPDLTAGNGAVIEKVEGLTVLSSGDALIVTDNDGVDDSSGETQLMNLGDVFN